MIDVDYDALGEALHGTSNLLKDIIVQNATSVKNSSKDFAVEELAGLLRSIGCYAEMHGSSLQAMVDYAKRKGEFEQPTE